MTLPDEKSNYVHRIGRVGRADRMGLALSFVSQVLLFCVKSQVEGLSSPTFRPIGRMKPS